MNEEQDFYKFWYNLAEVAEVDADGGWDFDVWEVRYDETAGVYYVGDDSGCSCYYAFDRIGPNTFRQYTGKDGVLRDFDRWYDGGRGIMKPDQAQAFKLRIRNWKP